MSHVSHENLQPLLHQVKQHGGFVFCIFKCPVSGAYVNAYADVDFLGIQASATVDLTGIRKQLGSVLRNALGQDGVPEKPEKRDYPPLDESQMRAAVAQAFRSVSSAFLWDSAGKRWLSALASPSLSTDLDKQLHFAAPHKDHDRFILACMLAATANADGKIVPEEIALLHEFIDASVGNVDEMLSRPVPSTHDIEEVSPGAVRQTLLMLSWTLALTDKELAPREETLLETFAVDLGLEVAQANGTKRYAQIYVVDRMIDQLVLGGKNGVARQEEIIQGAAKIGVDQEGAECALAQYQARNGLR
jgi:hypothetical protein